VSTDSPATVNWAVSEGLSPDAGPVIDVTRLRVALARLSRRLRRHELAGLTPTQLAALATVEQSGPMRLGDLAAIEGIAPSTLTRLITALEDSGYVQRCADPTDARASTLAVTPRGHEMLERIRSETTLVLAQSLQDLTPVQRSVLSAAVPVLEQLAEAGPTAGKGASGSAAGSGPGASGSGAHRPAASGPAASGPAASGPAAGLARRGGG
jgi:DNA-binding MarR family transcriptional regulator